MLCENCKKRTATVFYNENLNGKTRSYSLCGECAAKLREKGDLQDITSMIGSFTDPFSGLHDDLFGGFFGMHKQKALGTAKKCPDCGSTYADIAHAGRVGCPRCYAIFREELAPTIRSVHGTTTHTGALPSRHKARQERAEQIKNLKRGLRDAIQKEDFEEAARLRDEIRRMEAEAEEKKGE